MRKICFLNGGCGIHECDFRKIYKDLEETYSLTNMPSRADVIIQYFCAITQSDSVNSTFHELLYLSRVKKENAILIVCGCAVDVMGKDFFSALEFVDYAVGSKDMILEVSKILNFTCSGKYYLEDNDFHFSIKIVEGCHKKHGWCSFCKQNYMKRAVQSMPMEEICALATEVTTNSKVFQIALTGLNICNYGIDFGDKKPKLHLLIQALSKIPTVKFIYLYSLTVESMYEELNNEIATNPKILLVELPIQSGSNSMLKAMNTGSTVEEIQYLLDKFSGKPMRSIFVVSHPGETEESVQETINFIKKNNLWYTKVTDYKNSEGTPSYLMKQLEPKDFKNYYCQVLATVRELRENFLSSLVGSTITGYAMEYTYRKDIDVACIYIAPKDFVAEVFMFISNFSSSKYKTLLDNSSNGIPVRVKIFKVMSIKNVRLSASDLEVIE